MQRRTTCLMALFLLALGTLAFPWSVHGQQPVTSRFKLNIGGYIKPEFIYHSTRTAGFFGPGGSGVSAVVPQHNTLAGDNGSFSADAVESRFNFTITAPDWRGIKPIGFFELDFFNPGPVVADVSAGTNSQFTIFNSVPRIRHFFFRLDGEGLGGSWKLLFGQYWAPFGLQPHSFGSSLAFGHASTLFDRQVQLNFTHSFRLLRDLVWENTVAVTRAAAIFSEVPDGVISTRFVYSGWQGFKGGARAPLDAGFSALVGRVKADLQAGAAALPGSADAGSRSISNVRWGIGGYANIPVLPGRSATDRTWALTFNGEAHYGEGIADQVAGLDPLGGLGVNPLSLTAANSGSERGQAFFHPGKCSLGPPAVPGVAVTAPAGVACGGVGTPTELSLFRTYGVRGQGQFYLPWNLWVVGQYGVEWFSNNDNAAAATTIGGVPVVPILQGQGFGAGLVRSAALFGSRDAVTKRQWQASGTLFWDMTPNIRWGAEYLLTGTNRRASYQDNQDHRIQFGAYYFF